MKWKWVRVEPGWYERQLRGRVGYGAVMRDGRAWLAYWCAADEISPCAVASTMKTARALVEIGARNKLRCAHSPPREAR